MSGPAITMELQVESRLEKVEAALATAGLRAGLSAAGFVVEGHAKANIRERGLIDTGNMINSVQTSEPVVNGTEGYVMVSVGAEYGRIHEYGGTIVPRKAKFLAIPLTTLAKKYSSPRDFGSLHLATTLKGNYLLVDDSGEPQYLLRKSVTIPARPYLRPAVDEHRNEIQGAFSVNMGRVIEGAAR